MAILKEKKMVLIFSPRRVLIGLASSTNQAAKIVNRDVSSIYQASVGKIKSSAGLLWRYEDPNVEIELSDIGTLTIEEFDNLCGVEREYYPPKDIKRKK